MARFLRKEPLGAVTTVVLELRALCAAAAMQRRPSESQRFAAVASGQEEPAPRSRETPLAEMEAHSESASPIPAAAEAPRAGRASAVPANLRSPWYHGYLHVEGHMWECRLCHRVTDARFGPSNLQSHYQNVHQAAFAALRNPEAGQNRAGVIEDYCKKS